MIDVPNRGCALIMRFLKIAPSGSSLATLPQSQITVIINEMKTQNKNQIVLN